MRKSCQALFYITFLIILASCSDLSPIPKNDMPDIGISPKEMNTKIKLSDPEEWNTFKIGDEIALSVKVISNDQVSFPRDFGARIFNYDNNQWIEVDNSMKYDHLASDNYLLLPVEENPWNEGATSVVPKLSDTSKATTVRIIIVGYIFRDGQITNEKTAAYIDVNLKP